MPTTNYTISWLNDAALVAEFGENKIEYSKNVGNQLILCARMNTWDRFYAMLELKSPKEKIDLLKPFLGALDKQACWKFKETFARLSTSE